MNGFRVLYGADPKGWLWKNDRVEGGCPRICLLIRCRFLRKIVALLDSVKSGLRKMRPALVGGEALTLRRVDMPGTENRLRIVFASFSSWSSII